ncbi:MAG: cell division protein FtsW [Firmicutes bacterium]|nr:cell division protein FtsW [Bacillota bacterium]
MAEKRQKGRLRAWMARTARDFVTIRADEGYHQREKAAWSLPKRRETNFFFISCLVLLLVIGLIMVTSSSVYDSYEFYGDSFYYFRKQLMWILISSVLMVVAVYVPLKWYRVLAWPAYLLALFLVIAVLFFGVEVGGSKRWFDLGGIRFQPSECAKIAVAMLMAVLVDKHRNDIQKFGVFLRLLFILLLPCGLILMENLSTAVITFMIGAMILWIGGAKFKHFLGIVAPLAVVIILFVVLPLIIEIDKVQIPVLQNILRSFYYRTLRVRAWLDPFKYAEGDGYQTIQSLYAVSTGGFFGKGLGQSIQKLGFIPEAHNDIIFSVICEELGAFGALIVLVLFAGLIWNGVRIAVHAPNQYSTLLGIGMITQVAVQMLINVAVNTNAIPVTGVTLPFISYGGSSLLFLMISMGMILNISRYQAVPGKEASNGQAS